MTTVEAEKAEAMRRYNNRRSFRNILRAAAVASLCCLWFPTVMISLQAAGDWFYRTGAVFITDRSVVFVFANLLVALIFVLSCDNDFVLSCDNDDENSSNDTEPDLYDQYTSSSNNNESSSCDTEPDICDQYTSSSAVIVTASAEEKMEDDSNKQIVTAFIVADRVAVTKGIYRRTKSEMKKEIIRPVMEIRRTESAKVVAMERLSSEEFRLKVETFIMEKKRSLIQENDVVQYHGHGLVGAATSSGYGSCLNADLEF